MMNNRKVRFSSIEILSREVDQFVAPTEHSQPPRIAISANRKDGLSCIAETYVESVVLAGGAPIVIPVITDIAALSAILSTVDGLVMSGGGDINPLLIGEEPIPQLQDTDPFRDEYDMLLLRLATNLQIPVFGICRGHQVLNVLFGGSIYQDIYSQNSNSLIKHSQFLPREYASHTISLTNPSSGLYGILKTGKAAINSFHHQAIKDIAPEFIPTAVAPDGINEGMEHPQKQLFSVQWHPEAMAANGNEEMLKLFREHIRMARLYRQARTIHKQIITIDSHTDTPTVFSGSFDLGKKEGSKVNLSLMEEGCIDAAFMVAYIAQGERTSEGLSHATAYVTNCLQEMHHQASINSTRMEIARTSKDLIRLKQEGKRAIFLGIENGYALGKDLTNLSRFKELGVSYITLCHNKPNDICDSARGETEWNGLSPFGKEVVLEMNRLGIMIDLSHTSEQTCFDVLALSKKPVVASHSSVRALCNHPRNLTDEQIKAIADKGGVIQICLYKEFINQQSEKASLSDAIRHIQYIVDLVGIDYVGIGSDFDGDGELIGCRAANELINITIKLLEAGYTQPDIQKIWGGNFLRVINSVQETVNPAI